MRCRLVVAALSAAIGAATAAFAQENADALRGGELYRACVSCHSLEPGVHLTGPSLAAMLGREAGETAGFDRYSPGLKSAEFTWSWETLNAWLADPGTMIPGTYMAFRGIADDDARADLLAFLEIAMAPGGRDAVLAGGLAPEEYVRGQVPEPLAPAPAAQEVTAIRHCGESYFVTTADGTETPFFEMNVRLKLDTRDTGPAPGKPVIIGAGMMGDRVSIVFASVTDLTTLLVEDCR